jgi:diketogulonate reductase-like aldo/keto reductase
MLCEQLKWVAQQGIAMVSSTDKAKYTVEDMDVFDPSFTLTDAEMAELQAVNTRIPGLPVA